MSTENEQTMNYILIKYGEDETCVIDVFRTEESRELGTMLSIFGELVADNPEWNAHLQTLKRDRRIYFEGDPGVEWLDATDVSSVEADGTLHDITDLRAKLTTATRELAEARRELEKYKRTADVNATCLAGAMLAVPDLIKERDTALARLAAAEGALREMTAAREAAERAISS